MKQITIYDLLPLLKKGWVAMDADGSWCWFSNKPFKRTDMWLWRELEDWRPLTRAFNIAPFDGDWKDSLIKVEDYQKDTNKLADSKTENRVCKKEEV